VGDDIFITSRTNPRLRYIRSLHDRKTADHEGVVFVEGVRLCEDAFQSGLTPEILIFSENMRTLASEWCKRFDFSSEIERIMIPEEFIAKMMSTVHPQGIAAVIHAPDLNDVIPLTGKDLYFVLEGISDPGNLGTIIRTADAFAFSAVILTGDTVDPFNEKVLRASMGSCFHVPICRFSSISEICLKLKSMGVQLIASHLSGTDVNDMEVSYPAALFVGNEARGLSEECTQKCDIIVKIPMPGDAESLNAASAASIIAYSLSSGR
jgi:TrmH family RNA methyltransferase